MAEFVARHKNLDQLLAWVEKNREGSKKGEGKDAVQEVHGGGGEMIKIQKEIVPSNKESRPSTGAMAGLLLASM